jgi:hypothetical protein
LEETCLTKNYIIPQWFAKFVGAMFTTLSGFLLIWGSWVTVNVMKSAHDLHKTVNLSDDNNQKLIELQREVDHLWYAKGGRPGQTRIPEAAKKEDELTIEKTAISQPLGSPSI